MKQSFFEGAVDDIILDVLHVALTDYDMYKNYLNPNNSENPEFYRTRMNELREMVSNHLRDLGVVE